MALGAYLTIVAERQGPIRGSVTQKGREGKILVFAASHEIVSPRDPASGRTTGKRAHKPFVCTKETDRSSPLLNQALCTNENLPEVNIDFWASTPLGVEKIRYTVRLVNATISGITFKMANVRSPRLARLPEYEEVSFVYQRIEWTWVEGNITATDDWEQPRAA
jgi:type VI secretion system secreted protein Hcp